MALAHVIMTALLEGEQTGYDLARSFDTSLGFFWQASHQQIYAELRKLEENGWLNGTEVPQQGKPDKVVYGLTTAGHEALENWIYTATRPSVTKDELLVKLYNLSEKNVAYLIREITSRQAAMIKSLALYEKIRDKNYSHPHKLSTRKKGVYLVLLAGIQSGEQYLAWCDDVLQLLSSI